MFKNYICVSFKFKDSTQEVYEGIWFLNVKGKTSFEVIREKIAEDIWVKYEMEVKSSDITLTGINEISRRLYNRLKK